MTRNDINTITAAGRSKVALCRSNPWRYFSRAMVAGAFIMVGTLVSAMMGAWFISTNVPVAKVLLSTFFAAALVLIVLLGGELFTGANFVMGISLYERAVSVRDAVRVWVFCYVGNFVAILILALCMAHSGANTALLTDYLAATVPGKISGTWYELLLKGVLCNVLVCIGVFSGFKLKSESGKAIVIFFAVTTFMIAGFEHSIANMATFSLYALLVEGADVLGAARNLLFVTIGNMIGGAVVLGVPVWLSAEPKQD